MATAAVVGIGLAVAGTGFGVYSSVKGAEEQNRALAVQQQRAQQQADFQRRQAAVTAENARLQARQARYNAELIKQQAEIADKRADLEAEQVKIRAEAEQEQLAREAAAYQARIRAGLQARGLSGSASATNLQVQALGSGLLASRNIDISEFFNTMAVEAAAADQQYSYSLAVRDQLDRAKQFDLGVVDANNAAEFALQDLNYTNRQLNSQTVSPFNAGLQAGIQGAQSIFSASLPLVQGLGKPKSPFIIGGVPSFNQIRY